jgi:hypothetical protein
LKISAQNDGSSKREKGKGRREKCKVLRVG